MRANFLQDADVSPGNAANLRAFLAAKLFEDDAKLFGAGVADPAYLNGVADRWFNDQDNYDGRWEVISRRCDRNADILDMAAGCGTFLLYGLQHGYNVIGIEPEEWKRDYFRRKIAVSSFPSGFLEKMIAGYGEALPFPDNSFDLVTSYQTLEHVEDVNTCIHEMLRVTRPNGVVWIIAPDYNSFFEGHYRVPFLPCMNRKLAARYLRLLGRPIEGLATIQYVTEELFLKCLGQSPWKVNIEGTSAWRSADRRKRIGKLLPRFARLQCVIAALDICYDASIWLRQVGRSGRSLQLWIRKLS